jgi:polar amino acid transport system permease protein
MEFGVVWESRELLWEGLKYSFKLFFWVIIFGTGLGILVGVGLLYGIKPVKWILRLYVDVIRGLPLIVTIFVLFYGPVAYGLNLSPFQSIVLALSIFAATHMGEIVRGAVQSVPKGQEDAAKSLGLTFWPRTFSIILPQAAPIIMGPWTNLAVDMFKATSLALLVSQADFLFSIQKRAAANGHYMEHYIVAAIVYLVCCLAISQFGRWLTRRLQPGIVS